MCPLSRKWLLFLFLLFLFNLTFICGDATRIVESNYMKYRGHLSNDGFYQFLGIPYALIPDEHPFGSAYPYPLPTEPTDDIRNTENDAVHCPQMPASDGTVTGHTDCLNLHIFTPTTAAATSKLPVMVWIYGGLFHTGHASLQNYGPKYLVRHNVIFVTFNYRTGPYGFMCLDDTDVPGNQGLKDQYLAIKWVKDNIESFGGDSDQITLMGVSAGGHSVDLHLLSDRERLFNKAIIQSGSSLATTLLYPPDREAAIKIAQRIEYQGNSTREALEYLKNAPIAQVMQAADDLGIQFKPCVEREIEDQEPFITHQWVNASAPNAAGIPIMIGFSEYERVMEHINKEPNHFQDLNLFDTFIKQVFDFDNDSQIRMERYLRRFYLSDNIMSQETAWDLINFDSDFVYNYPIQRSIRKFLDSNAGNIFYYMFSYVGERNINRVRHGPSINVAGHGDEIGYLFDRSDMLNDVTEEDQIMIDRMTTLWTNFAKYGNPTPENTTLLPIEWVPLTNEAYRYLKIDSGLSMQSRPFNRRMAFLDLFYKLNENQQKLFLPTPLDHDTDADSATFLTSNPLIRWFTLVFLFTVYF